jgi:hypothetical protein
MNRKTLIYGLIIVGALITLLVLVLEPATPEERAARQEARLEEGGRRGGFLRFSGGGFRIRTTDGFLGFLANGSRAERRAARQAAREEAASGGEAADTTSTSSGSSSGGSTTLTNDNNFDDDDDDLFGDDGDTATDTEDDLSDIFGENDDIDDDEEEEERDVNDCLIEHQVYQEDNCVRIGVE